MRNNYCSCFLPGHIPAKPTTGHSIMLTCPVLSVEEDDTLEHLLQCTRIYSGVGNKGPTERPFRGRIHGFTDWDQLRKFQLLDQAFQKVQMLPGFVCNIPPAEGGSSMEILTWRSHTVLKPKAEGQYGSWRSEFPYCSQLRRKEWHSIFSIAFWSQKVGFGKTGLTSWDSMEIPSRLVSYQVWPSMRCEKIECLNFVSYECRCTWFLWTVKSH